MSILEKIVELELDRAKIKFQTQFQAIPKRKFAFDFFIDPDILIEIQGGQWIPGRHNLGQHMNKQNEKNNLAIIEGYKILYYSTEQVNKHLDRIIADIYTLQNRRKNENR